MKTSANHTTERDRFRGCLVGLAVGDALGTTLEFRTPGSFDPVDDMVGGGPFGLEPGQWTDDTSMALCLADSLLECQGMNPEDQMRRYVRWWRHGYRSSTGRCFDIGGTVREALVAYEASGNPLSGPTHKYSAGNGSLMRLAPVPLYFADDPQSAIAAAALSSRTTHGATAAIDACRYFAGLLVGALHGVDREELLAPLYRPGGSYWEPGELAPAIREVAMGSFKHREPPEIKGTGYVVRSMEAALWAFHRATGFRDGCLAAVNLGDDADTTGAIYGQIAGACWGVDSIPNEWSRRITSGNEIQLMADRLMYAGRTAT